MAMKRLLVPIFLCLTVFPPAAAESFRNCDWGNSEAQIREKESGSYIAESTLQEDVKVLVFGDILAELPALVVYILDRDRLVNAKYAFAEEHANANLYLADFARIGALLQETYGEPLEAGTVWQDGAGEEEIEWTLSIAIGELVLLGRWQTETTDIVHLLRGGDLQIYHEIEYIRRDSGEVEVRSEEKRILSADSPPSVSSRREP